MAVATVTVWQVNNGQLATFMEQVAQAKKIHERLGGKVRVMTNQIGGPAMSANYIIEHADLSAFAKFSDAMAADEEWMGFWMGLLGSATPSATQLSNSLIADMVGI